MNRKELVTTLNLVSRALADTNLIPIFQCLAFNKKTVTAYNDSIAIIAPCKTEEAFAVNGNTLLGLLSNSHSEAIEFSLDGQDLTIKAGRSTFKLPWFPQEDFLFTEPTLGKAPKYPVDEPLIEGLAACALTTSKDNAQAALMGVCLNQSQKHVTLYSTDGDAISRYTTPHKSVGSANHMLPNGFCDTLIQAVKDTKAAKGALEINEEWAKAVLDTGYVIYGRLLEADNPIDHEAWIKKTIKSKPLFVALPKGFDHALARARVVADAESAKTLLTVQAGRVKLLTTTSMGVVRDTLAFGEHGEVEANVASELVQRCASLCTELAIFTNCCCFRNGSKLFILTSNMGE